MYAQKLDVDRLIAAKYYDVTPFPIALLALSLLAACSGGLAAQNSSLTSGTSTALSQFSSAPVVRRGFLGAFFRSEGTTPFGVFSVYSRQMAPSPYPTPGTKLFGPSGYCDAVAANGVSISSGYVVDAAKLANIVDLGVKWTRTSPAQFFDDGSHIFGPGKYSFGDFDSAQCALVRHHITPLIALEAGPVQYNVIPDQFSPRTMPTYKTAADFGNWCSAVAKHETKIFTSVYRYSLPGNEVNSNPQLFPGGESQIAQYSEACYQAIKAVQPKAFVYAFELNMDGKLDPAAFVQRLYDLGCKVGTCYDGISIHLSLRHPIPPVTTPCYPKPGGEYSMQCIADIQSAAHAPIHVIIGETVYTVPGSVADETTKAKAVVAEMKAFAADKYVDGANYANIDECDLYASGYFVGGCLVDSLGNRLPGYIALKALSAADF